MSTVVRNGIDITGCNEDTVMKLFNFFQNTRGSDITELINKASAKFNLSPITIINVYQLWENKN